MAVQTYFEQVWKFVGNKFQDGCRSLQSMIADNKHLVKIYISIHQGVLNAGHSVRIGQFYSATQ